MTFFSKRKTALFLCAVLMLSLIFGGCSIKEDSLESRMLCETMVNHVIANDYAAAYEMIQASASQEEFDPLWHTMRDVFKDSKSFELEQKNWHKNWADGITATRVLFEIVTDDEKICQILISTVDGVEGIAGIDFLDSTEFVQKTKFLGIVNIFLSIFSVACFGFSIWMLVDCAKRRLKNKALWIILTLCHAGGQLTVGASKFYIGFKFNILSNMTNISADRTALAVTVTVLLPIGAIIYCIMRKRLTVCEEEKSENPADSNHTETESTPANEEHE